MVKIPDLLMIGEFYAQHIDLKNVGKQRGQILDVFMSNHFVTTCHV